MYCKKLGPVTIELDLSFGGALALGNRRVEWFKLNKYSSKWFINRGDHSFVLGLGGPALHIIPDNAVYEKDLTD